MHSARASRNERSPAFARLSPVAAFVDHPSLHHEAHVLELCDIGKWIALNRNDVGEMAILNASDLAVLSEQLRRNRRRRLDGRHRSHSVANHVGKFLGLVFGPGIAADVGSIAYERTR